MRRPPGPRGNRLDARVHGHHDERERAPDDLEEDEGEGAVAPVGPGEVTQAEQSVDGSVVGVEQEDPDGGPGDGGGGPRTERGKQQDQPRQGPDAGQQYGERAAHAEGGDHTAGGEDDGGEQDLSELAVAEQRPIVVEAFEGRGFAPADLSLGVFEEGDQAELVDRVGQQRGEYDECGREVEPGRPAGAVASTAGVRRDGPAGVGAGGEVGAVLYGCLPGSRAVASCVMSAGPVSRRRRRPCPSSSPRRRRRRARPSCRSRSPGTWSAGRSRRRCAPIPGRPARTGSRRRGCRRTA